ALLPYQEELRATLWPVVLDAQRKPNQRFRAACALAAFDPDSPHWLEAGRDLTDYLVAENPIHLRLWIEGFAPIRLALLEPLRQVVRDPDRPVERFVALNLLAEYAADQPAVLAETIKEADPSQAGKLLPLLQAHREQAVRLMQQEMQ